MVFAIHRKATAYQEDRKLYIKDGDSGRDQAQQKTYSSSAPRKSGLAKFLSPVKSIYI